MIETNQVTAIKIKTDLLDFILNILKAPTFTDQIVKNFTGNGNINEKNCSVYLFVVIIGRHVLRRRDGDDEAGGLLAL